MSFHIIDGDAPGLGSHRAVRTLALGCAWMVIAPAMLLASFGIYVLATAISPTTDPAVAQMSLTDLSVGLLVIGVLAASLFAIVRKTPPRQAPTRAVPPSLRFPGDA